MTGGGVASQGFNLSPHQKRLWKRCGAASDTARVGVVLGIDEPIGSERVRAAVDAVFRRHQILHTRYHLDTTLDYPLQIVDPALGFVFQDAVPHGRSQDAQPDTVDALRRLLPPALSCLEHAPQLRCVLSRAEDGRWLLLLDLPAPSADGASLLRLADDVLDACSHDTAAEPEPPLQYPDFAQWSAEEAEADLEHEREPAVPPSVRWNPAQDPADHADAGQFRLDMAMTLSTAKKAAALASKIGAGLEAVYLAAWFVLLDRLGGQSRASIGVEDTGRYLTELDDGIGLYAVVETMAQRVSDADRFVDIVVACDRQRTESAEDPRESWSEAVAEIGLGVGFRFLCQRGQASGVAGEIVDLDVPDTRFDALLSVRSTRAAPNLALYASGRVFGKTTGGRVLEWYATLLDALVSSPERRAVQQPYLSQSEQDRMIEACNPAYDEQPGADLADLLRRIATAPADAIAVQDGAQSLSYGELTRHSRLLGYRLAERGIGPESIVGILMERSASFLVAVLGILNAGAAFMPLSPKDPPDRIAQLIQRSGARHLLADPTTSASITEGATVYQLQDLLDADLPDTAGADMTESAADPACLAYVMHTSGSTGLPKGVMVTRRGLANYLEWAAGAYLRRTGETVLCHSDVAFDLSLTSLLVPLLSGGRIELAPQDGEIDWLIENFARDEPVGMSKLTPAHLTLLREVGGIEQAPPPRVLVVGGEILRDEHLDFLAERWPDTLIANEYGPTETVVGSVVHFMRADAARSTAMIPVGLPISATKVHLLDSEMNLVAPGVVGEIYIGGDGVARGYLGAAGLTADRFVPDPFDQTGGGRLYRTGDLARRNGDKTLVVLGRSDEQLKLRGYRVEPGEVAAVLSQHPKVDRTVVLPEEAADGTASLVAFAVSQHSSAEVVEELLVFAQSQLPGYMVPSSIRTVSHLPVDVRGKVDRAALLAAARDVSARPSRTIQPLTVVQEALSLIWSEVLGVDAVSIDDNFFALNGDSICCVRVVARARQLGLMFDVQDLFENQTVRELSEIARFAEDQETSARVAPFELLSDQDRQSIPPDLEDAYPMTALQLGMVYHMELEPERPAYRNVSGFRLSGRISPEHFRQAAQIAVDRHACLRTGFDLVRFSVPMQLVHRKAALDVRVFDLRHLDRAAQERAAAEYVDAERVTPFDLGHPPLICLALHLFDATHFQFTITECHAIIDGWSLTSIISEIFRDHVALAEGKPLAPFEPPSWQFRDYVRLERQATSDQGAQRFWTTMVEDLPDARLPVPAALRGNDAGRDRARRALPVALDETLEDGLRDLGRQAAAPLRSVCLAAHVKALSLIVGSSDVVTGLPTNGRLEDLDADKVRGLFLNTVPFRLRLDDESWVDLVRKTFARELEIHAHRRFPLAEIPRQDRSAALFDTLFSFVHFHHLGSLAELGLTDVHDEYPAWEATNYPMMVGFSLHPPEFRLSLRLYADPEVFSDEQVEGYGQLYRRVLNAMVADSLAAQASLTISALLGSADPERSAQARPSHEPSERFEFSSHRFDNG